MLGPLRVVWCAAFRATAPFPPQPITLDEFRDATDPAQQLATAIEPIEGNHHCGALSTKQG